MRIFVGGLAYSMTNESLFALFAQHGTVTEANVVSDRFSGQSKGFGFIDMPDATQAQQAIRSLSGKTVEGRPLTVNEAKPREDSGRGFGGRR